MTLPQYAAVIGGGQMGAGIAHAVLMGNSHVVLLERDNGAAEAARDRVLRSVAASEKRGLIDGRQRAEIVRRLYVTIDARDLARAELIIEAVPEDMTLKIDTLRAAADHVAASAVIATNTSSLSIDVLAQAVPHPERVLGLHFFNPVPASKLVEVVVGMRTKAHLTDTAAEWVRGWGKTAVVVRDSPGFASSRLGVAIGLEAIRMVEEGVADAADIDAAMTLGYGFPMGPLRLTDLVGLDVRLGIARYLSRELGPRFEPPALMVQMVKDGHLGKKSGRGFYEWQSA